MWWGDSKKALIDELKVSTYFDKRDLEKLFAHYNKISKGGLLDRKQFEQGLKGIGKADQVMIDQFFTAFDHDKDGYINFRYGRRGRPSRLALRRGRMQCRTSPDGLSCRVPCAVCRVSCAVCRVPCAVCTVQGVCRGSVDHA
jgi:hypothetical protein